jgi:hypothetical protein
MPSGASRFWWHTAAVETYHGTGSFGDDFDPPVSVKGMLEDVRQLVVSATGEQVVSESTFHTDLENADLFTVDSRVTVNGRTTRVLGTKRLDSAGFTNLDHLQVTLR